ncbi:MAG: indolepyruvate oxidoreductase subunit beta [Lachnospiraceae bacterium]|nr:indolepyruvate oxidoreductase subunit beta [Lachnospiraceae bacterium]
MEQCNVIITGVGGQGMLLACRVIGQVFQKHFDDVRLSELHGMSQRGGSVVTYVKGGKRIYSPLIKTGEADLALSFEKIESFRHVSALKKDGILIANTQEIMPMPVITGAAEYPLGIVEQYEAQGMKIDAIDAFSLAVEAGSARAVNMVLIGRVSTYFDYPEEEWTDAMKACIRPQFIDMNLKAFSLGRSIRKEKAGTLE